MVTTLSPCFNPMKDRYKNSCTDLIESTPIKTVFTALIDISETKKNEYFYDTCGYNIIVSDNKHISDIAKGLLKLIVERPFEK
jgi:pyrimidine deaminase RibD-like protein